MLFEFASYLGQADHKYFSTTVDTDSPHLEQSVVKSIIGLQNFVENTGLGKLTPSLKTLRVQKNKKRCKCYMEFDVSSCFEASTWPLSGFPVCTMMSGYCTGWFASTLGAHRQIIVAEVMYDFSLNF